MTGRLDLKNHLATCRLCLMGDRNQKYYILGQEIARKFRDLTSLELVRSAYYSKLVCSSCCHGLDDLLSKRSRMIDIQKKLRKYVEDLQEEAIYFDEENQPVKIESTGEEYPPVKIESLDHEAIIATEDIKDEEPEEVDYDEDETVFAIEIDDNGIGSLNGEPLILFEDDEQEYGMKPTIPKGKCKDCDFLGTRQERIVHRAQNHPSKHRKNHKELQSYERQKKTRCRFCDFVGTRHERALHRLKDHNKDEKLVTTEPNVGRCRDCNFVGDLKERYRHRKEKHPPLVPKPRKYKKKIYRKLLCPYCPKFVLSHNLKFHVDAHTRENNNTYLHCDFCEYKNFCILRMRLHMRMHQTYRRKKKCAHCDLMFISDNARKMHEAKKHLNITFEYKCTCGKVFKSESCLTVHRQKKHEVGEFKCSFCDLVLNNKFDFKTHEKNHNLRTRVNDQGVCEFSCSKCDKMFTSTLNLRYHMKTAHDPKTACEVCGVLVPSNEFYQVHMKGHERVDCPEGCGKKVTKLHLNHHLKQVHAPKKEVSCGICEIDFDTEVKLKRHMYMKHKKREFQCQSPGCNFSGASAGYLINHYKANHKLVDEKIRQKWFDELDTM